MRLYVNLRWICRRSVLILYGSSALAICWLAACAGLPQDRQVSAKTKGSASVAEQVAVSPSSPDSSIGSSSISVRVCSALATGTPCSPLAAIYTDAKLTSPKTSNEIDSAGDYRFYAKSDMYTVQVSAPGMSQSIPAAVPPTRSGTPPESTITVHANSDGSLAVSLSGGIIDRDSAARMINQLGADQTSVSPAQPVPPIIIRKQPSPQPTPPTPNPPSAPASPASDPPSTEPPPGSPIQYVAYTGDDSNDGLSWGTAKATVMAGYDALPARGGSIFMMQGPTGDPEPLPPTSTPGQGIKIMGPLDPNYNSPPPGWRHYKPDVSFIGVAATSNLANSHGAGQVMLAAGGSSPNEPCIWLSGLQGVMLFENILCPRAGRGIVLGETSNNLRDGTGRVVNVTFNNVSASGSPGVDITGMSFWLYFNACTFGGPLSDPNALGNEHAAMLVDGTGISGNDLIFVTNLTANEGGIKFISGSGYNSMTVNGMTEEGAGAPAIYVSNTTGFMTFDFENIVNADPLPGGGDAVMIDGDGPPGAVLVSGANTGQIVGPATVLSQYTSYLSNMLQTPQEMGQVGFFNGYLVGQTDAARANFSPVAVQFPNIAAQIPAQWTPPPGGTVTSGILAPDGTYGGGRASAPQEYGAVAVGFYAAQTPMAAGDYFIGGAWLRSPNPLFAGSATTAIELFGSNQYSLSGQSHGAITGTANVWSWQWFIYKVASVTGPAPFIEMGSTVLPGSYIDAYAPILLHIPSGAVSDAEAYQIATNLTSYPDGLSSGTVATLRGQQFAFGGAGNFFGVLTQSNTANRNYFFPDASGTVALTNLAQSWSATQTLNSPVLNDPTIDGQKLDSPPIATFSAFFPGTLSTSYTANTFTPDYPIVITRVEATLKTQSQGCTSSAVITAQQGSNAVDLPVPLGTADSGPVNVQMAAGTPIQISVSTPAEGCSTPPQDANVVVHYQMQ